MQVVADGQMSKNELWRTPPLMSLGGAGGGGADRLADAAGNAGAGQGRAPAARLGRAAQQVGASLRGWAAALALLSSAHKPVLIPRKCSLQIAAVCMVFHALLTHHPVVAWTTEMISSRNL